MPQEMTVVKRIKKYLDYKKINISTFEKSIGMSNASFGKSLKNNGSIGSDKLKTIHDRYPDLSVHWLVTGEGNMLETVPGGGAVQYDICRTQHMGVSEAADQYTVTGNQTNIPVFDQADNLKNIATGKVNPVFFVQIPGIIGCDGALIIRNMPLSPKINPGDLVFFKLIPGTKFIEKDKAYLISFKFGGQNIQSPKYVSFPENTNGMIRLHGEDKSDFIDIQKSSIQAVARIIATVSYYPEV